MITLGKKTHACDALHGKHTGLQRDIATFRVGEVRKKTTDVLVIGRFYPTTPYIKIDRSTSNRSVFHGLRRLL
jgi:hypothetical protein